MPELPEVETVMRGLAAPLEGQKIARVLPRRAGLRIPFPANLKQRVEGKKITRLSRRGKYILLDLEGGETLILHLGMSGRILVHAAGIKPDKHDHLILETARGKTVVFNDARRFGMVDLAPTDTLKTHPFFEKLGPEPLDRTAFTAAGLHSTLKTKKTSIKAALLDQRVVAGLGNIYVSEALYRAGIRPTRRADRVTRAEAGKLVSAIRDVLKEAIAAGGSSLKDYCQANGDLGYFQHRWAVYDKEGAACPRRGCKARIRRIIQSGRSSFYCPAHQK